MSLLHFSNTTIQFKRTDWIDRKQSYNVRGICMLMIITHHIFVEIGTTPGSIDFLNKWGYLATGVFFFLSGFGLFFSIKDEPLTFKWGIKKIQKLFSPFLFIFTLYCLFLFFFSPDKFNSSLWIDLATLSIPGKVTWFYKVIIALYVLTFLSSWLPCKKNVKVISIICLCALYFLLARYYSLPSYWWGSILNFPMGLLVALFYKWLPKPNPFYILLSLLATILLWYNGGYYSWYLSLCFTICCFVFSTYVSIDSDLLQFIGTNSLIFYLAQMIFLDFGFSLSISALPYSLWVFCGTFVLAVIYHKLENYIKCVY